MTRTRALISCFVLLLALAGCGDDSEPSSDPTGSASPSPESTESPSESPTGDTDDLCAVVTDQQLSDWAGRPVAAGTQASASGVTECTAVSEDGSIVVTWQTQESAGSLDDEVARADADGLDRSEVTVGDTTGALLVGTRTASRNAKVVAIVGDESLYVDVAWLSGVGPKVSLDSLTDIAVGVADAAAS